MRFGGFSTSSRERTQVAEEFRLVKRPLLLNASQKGPNAIRHGNMIMVASSRPGEGKTFCAVSLALSIASERDLTVLLIDADVAKPDVPRVLGFEADKGLVDVAADPSLSVTDVMLKTNLENLSIIPAGRQHPHATELLASERMGRIVDELSERYSNRIIVIDSPPVLMSSIAGVLALHVGQALFVIEADRTSQTAVDQSLALIKACKNISLLLNKSRALGTERFGAYNYYYR
jgi:receptor protein-tyrosine kinase